MDQDKQNLFLSFLYNVVKATDQKDFETKLKGLSEEDISSLQEEFEKQYDESQTQKKELGGKLLHLAKLKRGGKFKKMDCPCGKTELKKVGGKVVEECACGGKMEEGGELKKPTPFDFKMKRS